ncbi:hypothetical protein GCWU000341_02601 [Oribacterium sp. oral taxon 078 str. F0262]|nr:hypothetical protein GCWU000341_02601 [Oribacterium sp. oral taxon 078 str. F0262]
MSRSPVSPPCCGGTFFTFSERKKKNVRFPAPHCPRTPREYML